MTTTRDERSPIGGPPSSSLQVDRLGRVLAGRYQLGPELGRGGSSRVFQATDVATGKGVAIKVLRPEFAVAVGETRFLREIRVGNELRHPSILGVIEAGSAEGELFFVMPLVRGMTLRARIAAEGPLSRGEVIRIARDVAGAIDYAHRNGIIHRDIKPANILLENERALVSDFGIARPMGGEDPLTESGISIGTPEYMSPEQAGGSRQLDGRTDIYSLGCVVYEMLVGAPPFVGPTPQAVVARHCHDVPPSLRVVRPTLTRALDAVVIRALAKIPADRYATASDFIDALDAAFERPDRRSSSRSLLTLAAAGLSTAAIITAVLTQRAPTDPNRVVVFPLRGASGPRDTDGEGIATYIGYALEGTRPLRWLEPPDDAPVEQLTNRRASAISRSQRAGFFITGSIIRAGDSVTVGLELHSVDGDSVVSRAGATGPKATASLPHLGLRAVVDLLPGLVEPARKIDVSSLIDRQPTAVANFLQGEREYRRMQFTAALSHYRSAVAADSALALAAVRGAQAANWESLADDAGELIAVAMAGIQHLPPVNALIARGLSAYLTGAADSALSYLDQATNIDRESAVAWTLMGEVYLNMLPARGPADSLARAALERAVRLEPRFAPPMLLLEGLAFRDADLAEMSRLTERLRSAGAEASHAVERDLMRRCVTQGPAAIQWDRAVNDDPTAVLAVAKQLSPRAARADCAAAAFEAVLQSSRASVNYRWVSLLGAQSLALATTGRGELRRLFSLRGSTGLPLNMLYLIDGAAEAGPDTAALRAATSFGVGYAKLRAPNLWAVGEWEASRGNTVAMRDIVTAMRAKSDSFKTRELALISRSLESQLILLQGDTAAAMQRLQRLTPTARRNDVEWQPWEALARERLLLGELLLKKGQPRQAIQVATLIDAPQPIIYLLYLRPSLELRLRAATQLGDGSLAREYRARLQRLRGAVGD